MHPGEESPLSLKWPGPFPSFPLLRSDCERRGWYDSPQSALRPAYIVAQCACYPRCMQIVCGWVVRNSAEGTCVLCRRDLVAICL